MKIAIVSTMDEAPWGGSEELWCQMAEAALADGHQVNTLTTYWRKTPDKICRLASQGATVAFQMYLWRLPTIWHRRGQRLVNLVNRLQGKARFKSFELLRQWKPDVVCVSSGIIYEFTRHPGLTAYFESTRVPFVLVGQYVDDVRLPPWPDQAQRVCRVLERASRVVFVAQRNQHDTERHLVRRLPNAHVLRNPVNLTELNQVPWPTAQGLSLASVARLQIFAKGQDVLLEALSRPEWRSRPWTLNLYGKGPDREYLEELAEFYGISDKVCFHGQVENIRQVWAANHLLVMPSRGEGTPLVLVEAQVCGRPAVVTDVGGNVEWVEEGVTGFIADGPFRRSVGAALERAWKHREDLESMGSRAHQEAMNKIDHDPGKTLLSLVLQAASESPYDGHSSQQEV